MPDDVIVTERLVVRYRGKTALDGLDLRVPRGAVYAFLGDNGAGKTTTMKILTGLAPADAGRAAILGLDCWSRADRTAPPRRVHARAAAVLRLDDRRRHRLVHRARSTGPASCPRYREWADRLGLDPAKKLRDLSKGGYARVGLALALAPDPEVLLLDEPTSGLDLLTRREFLASLVELAASGRTILISSHSIAELEKACTHVGLLRDGKMILSSTLEELRKKVRRLSLRFADRAAGRGRPGHGAGAERDRAVLAGAGAGSGPGGGRGAAGTPGVTDFEDVPVTLEEVYAALMARSANGTGGGMIPLVKKVESA